MHVNCSLEMRVSWLYDSNKPGPTSLESEMRECSLAIRVSSSIGKWRHLLSKCKFYFHIITFNFFIVLKLESRLILLPYTSNPRCCLRRGLIDVRWWLWMVFENLSYKNSHNVISIKTKIFEVSRQCKGKYLWSICRGQEPQNNL